VTARNQATGISETMKSSVDGLFVFLYLVPGSHEVLIEKAGFHNVLFKDVAVNLGSTASIRPQMTLGKVDFDRPSLEGDHTHLRKPLAG
jgi:hypothetical protein